MAVADKEGTCSD